MNRRLSSSSALVALVAVAYCLAGASGFSYSRNLHDVGQDVADDSSLFAQDDHADINTQHQEPRKSKMMNYVMVKENPEPYVTIHRGQRLELTCEVDGNPPPRIYWVTGEDPARQVENLLRESVADVEYSGISREVSKFVIDCVKPEDQGLIHCVGVAGDKIAFGKPTVLNVIEGGNNGTAAGSECPGLSKPVITRHRPLYIVEMGSTVVLPCQAKGNPRPRITWLNGDNRELVDPRHAVQPNGDLIITQLRWKDMDGYKCVATSPLGEQDSALTFIYPAAKSEPDQRKANAL